jgi:hypothetical protein
MLPNEGQSSVTGLLPLESQIDAKGGQKVLLGTCNKPAVKGKRLSCQAYQTANSEKKLRLFGRLGNDHKRTNTDLYEEITNVVSPLYRIRLMECTGAQKAHQDFFAPPTPPKARSPRLSN